MKVTVSLGRIEQCHRKTRRPLGRLGIGYFEPTIGRRRGRRLGVNPWGFFVGRTGAFGTGPRRAPRGVTQQPPGLFALCRYPMVVVVIVDSGIDPDNRTRMLGAQCGRPFIF